MMPLSSFCVEENAVNVDVLYYVDNTINENVPYIVMSILED